MEKPAGQNIQESYLNTARRDKYKVTIKFLHGGDDVHGRIKSFDKFAILLDINGKDIMIFKHAISTVFYEKRNPPPHHQKK